MTITAPTDAEIVAEVSPCQVLVISRERDLPSIEPEWNILLQASNATVFQSFEWVTSCWKHYRGASQLYCMAFRVDGQLVGLAPLSRRTIRFPIRLCTVLEFIGRPHGDYNDLLVRPGFEQPVVRTLVAHFASGAARAEVFDLDEVPPSSSLMQYLVPEAQRAGIEPLVQTGVVCPFTPLPASFEEFLTSLGPNTRYNFKRKWAKLSENHKVVERTLRRDDEDLSGGLESFMRIHTARWTGLGFPSAFDSPVHRSFISEVSHRFALRDWLRLYLLGVDGVDVAASLEFAHRGRVYMYNSNASGPPEVMKQSPGLLVKLSAIRQGINEHMREYDMLRGEESYKSDHLKALERFNTTIRLTLPTATGRVRFRLYLMWLFWKKVIGRTRLEYHEWRRFVITKQPGALGSLRYFGQRVKKVTGMTSDFFAAYFKSDREGSGS